MPPEGRSEIMQRENITIFADYNQFYLWDKKIRPDAPDDYTDADVENRIKIGPHVVVVQPERNVEVPVAVETHDGEPGFNREDWDHIAEASLHLPSGELEVHECTGGPVAHFKLEPGWYRVRSFHAGLSTIRDNGLEGSDHYLVVLWPAPAAGVKVVKQYRPVGGI